MGIGLWQLLILAVVVGLVLAFVVRTRRLGIKRTDDPD